MPDITIDTIRQELDKTGHKDVFGKLTLDKNPYHLQSQYIWDQTNYDLWDKYHSQYNNLLHPKPSIDTFYYGNNKYQSPSSRYNDTYHRRYYRGRYRNYKRYNHYRGTRYYTKKYNNKNYKLKHLINNYIKYQLNNKKRNFY